MEQVRTSPRTMIIALLAAIALTLVTWLVMTGLPGVGANQASTTWNDKSVSKTTRIIASTTWNRSTIASTTWNGIAT